jgi:flagellar biosynthetic protein FliP
MKASTLAVAFLLLAGTDASAQTIDLASIAQGAGGDTSGRIVQMVALISVLSIAPGLLIMVTSFTRFAVALSFLRAGLGLQSTPANLVLISLALFMTFFVMAPVFDRAWEAGVKPLMERKITEQEAYARVTEPFRDFMLAHVRDKDLKLFTELAARHGKAERPAAASTEPVAAEPVDLRVLVPAFMISELRRGFEIGFLIILPFLVIDMVVATLVMSMGMMMMPPTVIALPVKVLFFILIDGWNLLIGSLVRSMV